MRTTFNAYDKDAMGSLTLENFKNMMARLDSKFTQTEIAAIFEVVDANHSKSIEFEELYAYFCKMNNMPIGP